MSDKYREEYKKTTGRKSMEELEGGVFPKFGENIVRHFIIVVVGLAAIYGGLYVLFLLINLLFPV